MCSRHQLQIQLLGTTRMLMQVTVADELETTMMQSGVWWQPVAAGMVLSWSAINATVCMDPCPWTWSKTATISYILGMYPKWPMVYICEFFGFFSWICWFGNFWRNFHLVESCKQQNLRGWWSTRHQSNGTSDFQRSLHPGQLKVQESTRFSIVRKNAVTWFGGWSSYLSTGISK